MRYLNINKLLLQWSGISVLQMLIKCMEITCLEPKCIRTSYKEVRIMGVMLDFVCNGILIDCISLLNV